MTEYRTYVQDGKCIDEEASVKYETISIAFINVLENRINLRIDI